jgi:hypothetical protein
MQNNVRAPYIPARIGRGFTGHSLNSRSNFVAVGSPEAALDAPCPGYGLKAQAGSGASRHPA